MASTCSLPESGEGSADALRPLSILLEEAFPFPTILPDKLSAWLNVDRARVYRAAREGWLPNFRIGGLAGSFRIKRALLTEEILNRLIMEANAADSLRDRQKVYFVRAASGPVKIGIALNVQRRLENLQISHFEALEVIAAVPGGRALEGTLHKRFAHLRLRGEWFRGEPELLAEIEALDAPKQHHQEGL